MTYEEALAVATANNEIDENQTFLIDKNLRTVTIPDGFVLGVFNDKNVQIVPFAMPRYYNGIDMSTFAIQVNYVNSAGEGDIYLVFDQDVQEDLILFNWVVDRTAFATSGKTGFVVCMKEDDEYGYVAREFNTTLAYAPVLEGLEIDNPIDEQTALDILTQIQRAAERADIAAQQAEDSAEQASTDANTASNAASSASTSADTATEAQRSASASATTASSAATNAVSARNAAIEAAQAAAQSAASLTVDTELSSTSTNPVQNKVIDATVTELKNDLTVLEDDLSDIRETGTNLFDKDNVNSLNAYIQGTQGSTGTLNANANAKTVYVPCEANTAYTVSKRAATARFSIACTSELPAVGVAVNNIATYAGNTAITITTDDSAKYLVAFIYLSTADTNVTFEQICDGLQIQTGSTATEYEPYKMTAIDDVARSRISVIEEDDALDGKFKNVQIIAVPQLASIGSALPFDISSMSAIGNATFSDGAWVISGGGSISGNISGITANKTYLIEMTVSGVSGVSGDINTNPATITLGDKSLSIFSAADANWNIALEPSTGGTVPISCTFNENWSGTISAITVKPINALASIPQLVNNLSFMANYSNVAIGGGQKKLLLSANGGRLNSAFGVNAQRDINTGMWNTAFGSNAQLQLTQGKGNNAFGCFSQNVLTTGCYNNAFGESAQNHMTDGQWNDGFGIEAQGMATSAKNNVAFGRRSQHLLQTGNFNTAIGAWSGFNSHDVSPEGANAVKMSSFTTLVGGASTLNRPDTGDSDYATALGYQTKVGKQGVAIGALAEADDNGIAIGFGAVARAGEVVIGNKKIIFNSDHTVTWEDVT